MANLAVGEAEDEVACVRIGGAPLGVVGPWIAEKGPRGCGSLSRCGSPPDGRSPSLKLQTSTLSESQMKLQIFWLQKAGGDSKSQVSWK